MARVGVSISHGDVVTAGAGVGLVLVVSDDQLPLPFAVSVEPVPFRLRNSIGRAYFDKKIAEGKSRNGAMRCLKRRLADHIWRMMIVDERRLPATPEGHEVAA